MGDIADMILDGTLAEDGSYQGGFDYAEKKKPFRPTKVACSHCGKLVKKAGLTMHIEAKHKEEGEK